MNDQNSKAYIEYLADEFTYYGDYELARRIANQGFNMLYNNQKVLYVTRPFYSVLSVIRRYRAKQKQNQPVTAKTRPVHGGYPTVSA